MSINLFGASTVPVLEQVVGFTQARHNLLAGNVANLDTPGYHVRDLSPEMFQTRLKQALVERDRQKTAFSPGVIRSLSADPVAGVRKSQGEWLHHDDTNGSLEGQVTAIAKNQLQHNVALSILTSQLRLLQTAISERA